MFALGQRTSFVDLGVDGDGSNPSYLSGHAANSSPLTEALDGVADFDAALREPEIPTQMRAVDDCGDGLHPSDSGYCKMGDAIDLALFDYDNRTQHGLRCSRVC